MTDITPNEEFSMVVWTGPTKTIHTGDLIKIVKDPGSDCWVTSEFTDDENKALWMYRVPSK